MIPHWLHLSEYLAIYQLCHGSIRVDVTFLTCIEMKQIHATSHAGDP